MDTHMTVLLHVIGEVLMAAIDMIEDLTPGDDAPLASVVAVLDEFEKARSEAPKIIRTESHRQLQVFIYTQQSSNTVPARPATATHCICACALFSSSHLTLWRVCTGARARVTGLQLRGHL